MWANSKLIMGGHEPVSVDNVAQDFASGVKLCQLLEVLTEKKIRGIDRRPRNPLQISANLSLIWKFMKNEEGLDLGGINTNDVQNGNEKIILALLFKYIQQYELDDDATDGLLEWVQPKTEQYYDVQNFTTSWKSGVALLALFDNIRPGVINMDEVMETEDDVEDHLAQAFDLFEEHLGVAKFLEVTDLMVPKPDKKSVMTYIAALRNAANRDEENRAKAQADANAGHLCKGEELYNQGTAKYVQASADDESHLDDIVEETIPLIEDCDGSQEEYDAVLEKALKKLEDATSRYDSASGKFEAAKAEFSQVDDGSADEWLPRCEEKIVEVAKHKRDLEEQLKDRLKLAIKNAKGKKKLMEAKSDLENAIEESGNIMSSALTEAYEKIDKSKNEAERQAACDEAEDKLKSKTKIFGDVKEEFLDAERLLEDESLKTEAQEKADECDRYAQQALDVLHQKLLDACKAMEDKNLSDEDLLQIYHAFSCQIEQMLDEGATDPGIDRAQGVARSRLDGVKGLLAELQAKNAAMRGKLHAALDESLDSQGLP
jgi:hypothetical protein